MSTFKNIQGKNIRSYANNAPNATAGEMWYNQTELKLKGVTASGAWSSSSPLLIATATASMFGTQNAAIYAAGQALTPGPSPTANTLEYNGSGWTSLPTLASGARKELGGCGTTTAGLVFGGFPPTTGNTEEWNGSAWSEQNNLGTARYKAGSAVGASQTADLAVSGTKGSSPYRSNNVEEYDGSSWTAVTVIPTTVRTLGGLGTQTAFLGFGGYTDANTTQPASTASFEYDGTNWTAGGSLLVGTASQGGAGTQTAGLAFGGRTPSPTRLNTTVDYDGTSWSANPATLGTGRSGIQGTGAGSNTAASTAGGATATTLSTTEEYNFGTNTITAAAWAAGGNMNVGRDLLAGAGTQTAALGFGSEAPPGSGTAGNKSESYDGTSWTETPTLQTKRDSLAGAGTQTAALAFGGDSDPGGGAAPTGATEEWNGSS